MLVRTLLLLTTMMGGGGGGVKRLLFLRFFFGLGFFLSKNDDAAKVYLAFIDLGSVIQANRIESNRTVQQVICFCFRHACMSGVVIPIVVYFIVFIVI
jgi:hypothetical protein